jgi:hypothetical protein
MAGQVMGYDLVVGYLTAVKILETFLLVGLKSGRFSIDAIYDLILNPKTWDYLKHPSRTSF